MKITISLSAKVLQSANALAKRLEISQDQLFEAAVVEYLARHKTRMLTEQLNAFYSDETSPINIDLEWIQSAAVGKEEW